MRIYVARHGSAQETAPSGKDFDRVLTEQGRERVRAVARALARRGERPDAILTSPLARALQTAEVIASEFHVATVATARDLAPGGDIAGFVNGLVAGSGERLLLVGHQPDLSMAIEALTGARFPFDMQKAMVVGMDAPDVSRWSLRFVVEPKTLQWHEAGGTGAAADRAGGHRVRGGKSTGK